MATELTPLKNIGDIGALPPAAVLHLGAAIAARKPHGAIGLHQVLFDADGAVVLHDDTAAPLRWQPPEVRRRILDDQHNRGDTIISLSADEIAAPTGPTDPRALWSLGRLLLELALGHTVDDDVVDDLDLEGLMTMVDVEGRPLPPRLAEVLAALLAGDPNNRLQSAIAAQRVCETVERDFGDGDLALRRLLQAGQPRPLARTADLPARAILSPEELRDLDARAIALLQNHPTFRTPQPLSLHPPPRRFPTSPTFVDDDQALQEAASTAMALATERLERQADAVAVTNANASTVANAVANADDDDEEIHRLQRREQRHRLLMLAGLGATVVLLGLLWVIVRA